MVGPDVQSVEVVPLRFDLRPLVDLVPHRDEQIGNLVGHESDRVPGTAGVPQYRQRHVDCLFAQHPLSRLCRQYPASSLVLGGDGLLGGVDAFARVGFRRRRQGADLAARQHHRRLVPQVPVFDLVERVEIGRLGEFLRRGRHRLVKRLR